MKDRTSAIDLPLMLAAFAASLFGLFAIWDSGYARAAEKGAIMPAEVFKQAIWLAIALGVGIFATTWHQGVWRKWGWPALILSVLCLGLVLVPGLGKEIGGAKRWIEVGPVTMQPAEFVKLGVILFLAGALAYRKPMPTLPKKRLLWFEKLDWVTFPLIARSWPIIIAGLAFVGIELITQDLDTAAALVVVMLGMMLIAGVKWTRVGFLVLLLGAGAMIMTKQQDYRDSRISAHYQRWEPENRDDIGYQATISESGHASGGIFGVGLGEGRSKHILPVATTDFIMATVAEEFGLAGSLSILFLLGFIVWRLMSLAAKADMHPRLILGGAAIWIGAQTVANMAMANASLPTMGIPLPFVSAGGSSLIALWLVIGAGLGALVPAPVKEEARRHATRRNGWRNGRPRVSRA